MIYRTMGPPSGPGDMETGLAKFSEEGKGKSKKQGEMGGHQDRVAPLNNPERPYVSSPIHLASPAQSAWSRPHGPLCQVTKARPENSRRFPGAEGQLGLWSGSFRPLAQHPNQFPHVGDSPLTQGRGKSFLPVFR